MTTSLEKWRSLTNRYLPDWQILLFMVLLSSILASGCSINPVAYSDGNLTSYFQQPIPKLQQPLATTLSFKSTTFYTPASMEGSFRTNLRPNNKFTLPSEVGQQVKALLQLEQGYSEQTTIAALNAIAKAWTGPGTENSLQNLTSVSVASVDSGQFIDRQSQMASDAYSKGDYLTGNTHVSAMEGSMAFQRGAAAGTAVLNATIGGLQALAIAGEEMQKNSFNNLQNWLTTSSGAIGPTAPNDRHLDVFFFSYLDGKMFSTDSRMRLAVMLVLLDENGIIDRVVEGSDVLTCNNQCDRLMPLPTAQLMEKSTDSTDVRNELWTPQGRDYLIGSGFDGVGGLYQYLLLRQGLQKLSKAVN